MARLPLCPLPASVRLSSRADPLRTWSYRLGLTCSGATRFLHGFRRRSWARPLACVCGEGLNPQQGSSRAKGDRGPKRPGPHPAPGGRPLRLGTETVGLVSQQAAWLCLRWRECPAPVHGGICLQVASPLSPAPGQLAGPIPGAGPAPGCCEQELGAAFVAGPAPGWCEQELGVALGAGGPQSCVSARRASGSPVRRCRSPGLRPALWPHGVHSTARVCGQLSSIWVPRQLRLRVQTPAEGPEIDACIPSAFLLPTEPPMTLGLPGPENKAHAPFIFPARPRREAAQRLLAASQHRFSPLTLWPTPFFPLECILIGSEQDGWPRARERGMWASDHHRGPWSSAGPA